MLLALESFYVVTVGIFKVSLGLFFLRVLIEKWQRKVVHWTLIIFSTYSVGYFFYAIFQCGIPNGAVFWERKITSQCTSDATGLGLGYTHGILTALTDMVFVVLPFPVVRRARLNLREKMIVGGILGLATM
jgi:hypothetical protein